MAYKHSGSGLDSPKHPALEDRAAALGKGVKNPENEFAVPAPMPDRAIPATEKRVNDDIAGNQGGQYGGGRDAPRV